MIFYTGDYSKIYAKIQLGLRASNPECPLSSVISIGFRFRVSGVRFQKKTDRLGGWEAQKLGFY